MMKSLIIQLGVCGLLGCVTVGCQQKKGVVHGEEFLPEDVKRTPQVFAERQAAAGAKSDATLNKQHFNGETLNSLGRAKIDEMLAGTGDAEAFPLQVYMNVPQEGATAEAQRQSVTIYLRDRGVLDSQFRLVAGPNPDAHGSAASSLSDLHNMDSRQTDAGAADANTAVIVGGTSK